MMTIFLVDTRNLYAVLKYPLLLKEPLDQERSNFQRVNVVFVYSHRSYT